MKLFISDYMQYANIVRMCMLSRPFEKCIGWFGEIGVHNELNCLMSCQTGDEHRTTRTTKLLLLLLMWNDSNENAWAKENQPITKSKRMSGGDGKEGGIMKEKESNSERN